MPSKGFLQIPSSRMADLKLTVGHNCSFLIPCWPNGSASLLIRRSFGPALIMQHACDPFIVICYACILNCFERRTKSKYSPCSYSLPCSFRTIKFQPQTGSTIMCVPLSYQEVISNAFPNLQAGLLVICQRVIRIASKGGFSLRVTCERPICRLIKFQVCIRIGPFQSSRCNWLPWKGHRYEKLIGP